MQEIKFTNIKREHLSLIKDWRNQQTDILRQVKPLTDSDQKKWFAKIKKDKNQKLFSILENKKLIGYCGLTNIDYNNKRAEVSFLVSPSIAKDKKAYQRNFLTVLEFLCNFGFKSLKMNKIFAETVDFRKSHIKILEKFGFKKEAKLKQQYFKMGKFCDSVVHSIFTWSNSARR